MSTDIAPDEGGLFVVFRFVYTFPPKLLRYYELSDNDMEALNAFLNIKEY